MNIKEYNKALTTAKCCSGENAPDFNSIAITAQKGACIVFDGVDFTGAKCLLAKLSVDANNTSKPIEIYADEISEQNSVGTVLTAETPAVSSYEFFDCYADLSKKINGLHSLIFFFADDITFEFNMFKLTAYNGTETQAEHDKRMKWWRDAKFGLFIHYGAYSYLGGEYLGTKVGWYSEWIMDSHKISREDYAKNAAAHFNPENFDAKKIVADAKVAGQKYLVITSRHHEGLSIYGTKVREFKDYCLMNKSTCPEYNGGDILKELSEECKKQGIHFGIYTTIMDWHDIAQDGWNNNSIAPGHTKAEYKTRLKAQLRELIESYGAEVFFFDGEWIDWWTEEDGREVYRFIRSLNENCIINNRVGKRNRSDGDYGTPEQEIPINGLDYDWESNVTMNDSFGYKKGDTNWKSVEWIIYSVADVASKGGNMLLNVGPDGTGIVEAAPLERMAEAGKWFAKFGASIYGTRKTCFSKSIGENIRITTNPEAGKIFVILLDNSPEKTAEIIIPHIENEITAVTDMADGSNIPYRIDKDGICLDISSASVQKYAAVYEISVVGIPTEKPAAKSPLKNAEITIEITEEKHSVPFTVKGTYKGGSKVIVRVLGTSFASFDVKAAVDENGKWEAVIDRNTSIDGITLTAMLFDANGNLLDEKKFVM